MRLSDYYAQTDDRSSGWVERSAEPGFAPCADLIHASRAYLRKGGRVLDIGCQGGHQLALIQEDYREAVGIDIADYSAMWKRSPAIRFRVHDVDAEPLPFPDGHFSCVVCTNVLEHVFDVFQLVREIGRVLERGGTGLIAVPNVTSFRHIISLVRGRIPRTGTNRYPFTETDGWDGLSGREIAPAARSDDLLTADVDRLAAANLTFTCQGMQR